MGSISSLVFRYILYSMILLHVTGTLFLGRGIGKELNVKEEQERIRVGAKILHDRIRAIEQKKREPVAIRGGAPGPDSIEVRTCCERVSEYLGKHPAFSFIKVYGLFNTGTNYVMELMRINGFDVGYNVSMQCLPRARTGCVSLMKGWKHGDPNTFGHPLFPIPIPINETNILPVIMIRNPISWFLSMMRVAYNMGECMKHRFRPCEFVWGKQPCHNNVLIKSKYSNAVLSWGEYYSRMLKKIPPTQAFYIRYEDLVLDPIKVLDRLQIRVRLHGFGCTGPCITKHWVNVSVDSREWLRQRNKRTFEHAHDKIEKQEYLSRIPSDVRQAFCNHRETKELIRRFYYTEDCSTSDTEKVPDRLDAMTLTPTRMNNHNSTRHDGPSSPSDDSGNV